LLRHAGFSTIGLQLVTRPDTEGRLLAMIKSIADYASGSGKIGDAEIDSTLFNIEQACANRSYLFLAPQFVVTAIH
jgi:hypothetical protein